MLTDAAARWSRPSNDPQPCPVGRRLIDLLGPGQPLTTFGAPPACWRSCCRTARRACHRPRLADPVRTDRGGAIASARARVLALDHALTVTLSATTGFVVLILGFAFHWQATRAREADLIYDTVRGRIDTALNRGRCGLWDWDLARGRISGRADVRPAWIAGQGRSSDIRRRRRPGASGRSRTSTALPRARRRRGASPSITRSVCGTPTAAGSGCGRAANWPARTAKPACI